MKKIRLFHGSNVPIETVDLAKSNRGKDFGCGFYLNPNETQAREMAEAKAEFLGGEPVVSIFEFLQEALENQGLKIKIFEDYTQEWAEFIALNRQNYTKNQAHDYDIVIGPIADDNVGVQIRRFINGYISVKELVEELRFKKKSIQYFFATEQSLHFLKKI